MTRNLIRRFAAVVCSYRPTPTRIQLPSFTRLHSSNHNIPTDGTSTPIGKVDPRLRISFTCTVTDCGERSTHEFSKNSYTKGIVIVQCPGCKNRHLIADNLGWFNQPATGEGTLRTVEDLMKAKGEKVRKGVLQQGGETIEFSD
ncbi:zf-DNL-domain-containing protein [Wallemia mellicola]|nr:zf-DNL-domain-containing protein [Wallemia mellicola]